MEFPANLTIVGQNTNLTLSIQMASLSLPPSLCEIKCYKWNSFFFPYWFYCFKEVVKNHAFILVTCIRKTQTQLNTIGIHSQRSMEQVTPSLFFFFLLFRVFHLCDFRLKRWQLKAWKTCVQDRRYNTITSFVGGLTGWKVANEQTNKSLVGSKLSAKRNTHLPFEAFVAHQVNGKSHFWVK